MRRLFTHPGVQTYPPDTTRYADGWYCGGQMGDYFCGYPFIDPQTFTFRRSVAASDCSVPGCPKSYTIPQT